MIWPNSSSGRGNLGVITEVTLKINPSPPCHDSRGHLCQIGRCRKSDLPDHDQWVIPSVMEILDKVTLQSIKENTDIDLPEAEAMILTETDGYTWEEVEVQMEVVLRILKQNNPQRSRPRKTKKIASTSGKLENRLCNTCPSEHQFCPG